MNRQVVAANDPRLRWPGAVSLQLEADGVSPWRLPVAERTLYHAELQRGAAMPAGGRVTFRTDSRWLAGTVAAQPEATAIDLVSDGELLGTQPLTGRDRFEFADLPAGNKQMELWLPQFDAFRLWSLELETGATLEPRRRRRKRGRPSSRALVD